MSKSEKWFLVCAIFLIGCALRLYIPISSPSPLVHDGGFPLILARDLVANHFRLPENTSYNLLGIPFAYPPLATYVLAALTTFFSLDPMQVLKFLPPLLACLTMLAFWRLANFVFNSERDRVCALALFSFVHGSFFQLIKSGGISRSFGALFFLLAAGEVYRISSEFSPNGNPRISVKAAFAIGILFALTLLSHPEWSLALMLFIAATALTARSYQTPIILIVAALLGGLFSSPWWGTVVSYHGILPFFCALLSTDTSQLSPLGRTILFQIFPITPNVALVAIAVFGLFVQWHRRARLIPLFALLCMGLQGRGVSQTACLSFAILGAQGISFLASLLESDRDKTPRQPLYRYAAALVCGLALSDGLLSATPQSLPMATASNTTLETFKWIQTNTPLSARFIVISNRDWWMDSASELFPALAGRTNLSTCQGQEWRGRGTFQACLDLVNTLRNPIMNGNESVLRAFVMTEGITHVLVVNSAISKEGIVAVLGPEWKVSRELSTDFLVERVANSSPA